MAILKDMGTIYRTAFNWSKFRMETKAVGEDYNKSTNFSGTAGTDYMFGFGGNDTMDGGNGNDELYGGAGKDVLTGGAGADKLFGGGGDDTLNFDRYDTVVHGGKGNDTLSVNADHLRHGDTLKVYGGLGSDYLQIHNNAGGFYVSGWNGVTSVIIGTNDGGHAEIQVYNVESVGSAGYYNVINNQTYHDFYTQSEGNVSLIGARNTTLSGEIFGDGFTG